MSYPLCVSCHVYQALCFECNFPFPVVLENLLSVCKSVSRADADQAVLYRNQLILSRYRTVTESILFYLVSLSSSSFPWVDTFLTRINLRDSVSIIMTMTTSIDCPLCMIQVLVQISASTRSESRYNIDTRTLVLPLPILKHLRSRPSDPPLHNHAICQPSSLDCQTIIIKRTIRERRPDSISTSVIFGARAAKPRYLNQITKQKDKRAHALMKLRRSRTV